MNRSNILFAPIAIALFLAGCDRSNPADSLASNEVAIAPRILAAGPLHGARVHLSLVHGHDTTGRVDTTYTSGRHLALGSVPVGDSFEVVVRGYDVAISGFKQITWNGIVRSQALGSATSLLAVDIHADTVAVNTIDTAYDPTSIYLPDGAWYTTNGADPRVKDTGAGVHVSDGSSIPKTGIVVVATKSASGVPGDSIWSPLQRLNFDSLTSGMRTLLTGVWWEDGTNAYGSRRIYLDTFKSDGTFKRVQYDTLKLVPKSVESGTWLVNGNNLKLTNSDNSYYEVVLAGQGGAYTMAFSDGSNSLLARTKPVASIAPYAMRTPLVGAWWDTYTNMDGAIYYYSDSLRADSTFIWIEYDAKMALTGLKKSGRWSADSVSFIYRYSDGNDTASMSSVSGGFRLDFHDGAFSVFKKSRPDTTPTSPADSLHDATAMAALAGTWWFDTTYQNSSMSDFPVSIRYNLNSDGTFHRTAFVSLNDSVVDSSNILMWGASAHTLRWTIGSLVNTVPYVLSSGKVKFLDGSGDSLVRTTASLGNPALVGTWVEDTSNAITISSNGTVSWLYGNSLYSYFDWSVRGGTLYLFQAASSSGSASIENDIYSISGKDLSLYGHKYTKQ